MNMGAWRFVQERFLAGDVPGVEGRAPRYVGRRRAPPQPPGHTRPTCASKRRSSTRRWPHPIEARPTPPQSSAGAVTSAGDGAGPSRRKR